MRRMRYFLWMGIALFFIVTCSQKEDFYLNTKQNWFSDFFIQNQFTERYDFLWVIDNSGSMSNIHDFLSQNLNQFVSTLESRRSIDWQMAVTITDHVDYQGNLVASSDGTRVVSYQTPNVSQVWASIINNIPSTSHSGWEQGLESAYSSFIHYANEFTRPETPIIVVYASDEEDYSCESNCNNFSGLPEQQTGWIPFPISRYVDQYASIKQSLNADVILYPVVHLQPLGGSNPCQDNYGFMGSRYISLQQSVGTGANLSICENDLAQSFNTIAELTSNLGVCFALSNIPKYPENIVVTVNGNPYQNGYQYESQNQSICFLVGHVPPNGSQITVSYE